MNKLYGRRAAIQFFVLLNLVFVVIIQFVIMLVYFHSINNTLNRKINLNDGNKIFSQENLQIEPNSTISSTFFIENQSDLDVYFRIYLDRLTGTIIPYLSGTLSCGDEELISKPLEEMQKEHITKAMGILLASEKKDFIFTIRCSLDIGDVYQTTYVKFDIKVDVIQVKDNPNGDFDR